MARKSDFITLARTHIKNLMAEFDAIKALNREYAANGSAAWLSSGDFVGANSDITEANFETAFGNAATLDAYVATQNYDDTFFTIF